MAKIVTTYIAVVLLLSLGIFSLGALTTAAELRDPMQPPLESQMHREATLAANPQTR